MSHKDALQLLIPLELGGVLDDDLTVEGLQLDRVASDIEVLRQTIITESVPLLPATDNRIQMVSSRGDIKKPYFIALAAALGYTITIDDYTESMADWLHAGDELLNEPWDDFSAGMSGAGDALGQESAPAILPACWLVTILTAPAILPSPILETIMLDLKPAHIHINFSYPEA